MSRRVQSLGLFASRSSQACAESRGCEERKRGLRSHPNAAAGGRGEGGGVGRYLLVARVVGWVPQRRYGEGIQHDEPPSFVRHERACTPTTQTRPAVRNAATREPAATRGRAAEGGKQGAKGFGWRAYGIRGIRPPQTCPPPPPPALRAALRAPPGAHPRAASSWGTGQGRAPAPRRCAHTEPVSLFAMGNDGQKQAGEFVTRRRRPQAACRRSRRGACCGASS
eukprot:COSAG04_NODE_1385_length_6986_cov_8.400755_3_plen_224_part_00